MRFLGELYRLTSVQSINTHYNKDGALTTLLGGLLYWHVNSCFTQQKIELRNYLWSGSTTLTFTSWTCKSTYDSLQTWCNHFHQKSANYGKLYWLTCRSEISITHVHVCSLPLSVSVKFHFKVLWPKRGPVQRLRLCYCIKEEGKKTDIIENILRLETNVYFSPRTNQPYK